jgi:Ca2+-binding RTX toxin-like protein
MTVITESDPTLRVGTGGHNRTVIVANDVRIGALRTEHQGTHLVNYGTIGPSNFPASVDFYTATSSGTFINKADGVVLSNATYPVVRVQGVANIVNEGMMASDSGHGIAIEGAGANIFNSGDLYAYLNGIWVSGSNAHSVTIRNSGEIRGDANGIHLQFAQNAAPAIVNSGVITGRANSIVATDGDRLNVTNTGTLDGDVIATSAGLADSVKNDGQIFGDVWLGSGIDEYRGTGIVSGIVFGQSGNDTLQGGSFADRFNGGSEADTLTGNGGNDILNGTSGNDKLFGGLGIDNLSGGADVDFFVFDTAPNTATNRDFVNDFSHVSDTLQFENAVFTKLGGVGMLNAQFLRLGAAPLDANDYVIYDQATGVLTYDVNGNGAGGAQQVAILTNKPALALGDFVVI